MTVLCLGILAAGAGWEAQALQVVESTPRMMVLRRCVDLDDLMASVTTGQLQAVVVAAEVPGLDVASVRHLTRHGVAVVAVLSEPHPEHARERLGQLGIRTVVTAGEVPDLARVVRALGEQGPAAGQVRAPREQAGAPALAQPLPERGERGPSPGLDVTSGPVPGVGPAAADPLPRHVLAVWGPVGAPGRTTVALGVAGLLAGRGRPVIVVDADPHASVAQHLGVLDQVSGLLAASRLHAAGTLPGRVQGVCRALSSRLGILTGLPRPDRRDEVLPGAVAEVVDEIATFADVVVDLGSDLEADAPVGSSGAWALEVLERADEVLVVGAADPVGLTRLAHALADLREAAGDLPVRVLVNRTRPTLGWSEKEMADLVAGFAPVRAMHFLPDDRAGVDRAVVAGEPVTADSRLGRALTPVVDAVRPETVPAAKVPRSRSAARGLLRRRTAGTALPQ